jgi:hypothetical protein
LREWEWETFNTWNQHMFLNQTDKHPERQKYHLQQTNLPYKPHKKEKERVWLTVGGDRLDYSGNVTTSTAYITTFKILISSTPSTENAVMTMMYVKNYYLVTPLPRFECMIMLLPRFSEEIVQKYNLNALAVDGWVYI